MMFNMGKSGSIGGGDKENPLLCSGRSIYWSKDRTGDGQEIKLISVDNTCYIRATAFQIMFYFLCCNAANNLL